MSKQTIFDKTFKDKSGKVVLWQTPNWPIIAWAFFRVLSYFGFPHRIHDGFDFLADSALLAWSVLELTKGVNYFRRGLGLIVLVLVVIGRF